MINARAIGDPAQIVAPVTESLESLPIASKSRRGRHSGRHRQDRNAEPDAVVAVVGPNVSSAKEG
jgi:hypothetical protein